MKRKFKKGDRVRVKPTSPWLRYFLPYSVDCVGTVIGYDEDDFVLVKFANFTNGNSGSGYYSEKGIKYDLKNCQHWYMQEKNLCLLEGEEHDKKRIR